MKKSLLILLFSIFLSLTTVYASGPLATADWLAGNLDNSDLVILDVRYEKDTTNQEKMVQSLGRIPGARDAHYFGKGWRGKVNDVEAVYPGDDKVLSIIQNLGIDEDSTVVIYDEGLDETTFSTSARIYWTLKKAGLTKLSILDGGFEEWKKLSVANAENYPIEKDYTQDYFPSDYEISEVNEVGIELDELRVEEEQGRVLLLDARPEAFFNGAIKHDKVTRYGNIPGSVNIPIADFFESGSGRLKNKSEIELQVKDLNIKPGQTLVVYCNSGHWAAGSWFVLSEMFEFNLRMYDGSMIEWSAHKDLPLQTNGILPKILNFFI